MLVIWNRVFRPAALHVQDDQVFDQNFLILRFSKTALQLLSDKIGEDLH